MGHTRRQGAVAAGFAVIVGLMPAAAAAQSPAASYPVPEGALTELGAGEGALE